MRFPLTLALLATAAVAQTPPGIALTSDLFVPIRAEQHAGDGLWAAGESYKASFDDGFRFVPYLGDAYPDNLPFAWATVSVRIGTLELASAEPKGRIVHGSRYEYDLGQVTEAYDASARAVEQTFSIATRPAQIGELVVTGTVSSSLTASPRSAEHAGLKFRGPNGEVIVEYGAATAIDATGRAFPMTTSWDGKRVRLILPAGSVEAAEFPLIVDPVILSSSSAQDIGMVDLAGHSGTNEVFVVLTRIASASDHDAYAFQFDSGWTNRVTRIADVSSTRSCNVIDVCSFENTTLPSTVSPVLVAYEQRYSAVTYLRIVPLDFPTGTNGLTKTGGSGVHFRNPHLVRGAKGGGACLTYDRVSGSNVQVDATLISADPDINAPDVLVYVDVPGAAYSSTQQLKPRAYPIGSDSYRIYFAVTTSSQSTIYDRQVTGQWAPIGSIWGPWNLNVSWSGGLTPLMQSGSRIYSSPRIARNQLMTFVNSPRALGFTSLALASYDVATGHYTTTDTLHAGQLYTNGEIASDPATGIAIATFVRTQGGLAAPREVRFERIGSDGRSIGSLYSSTQFTPRNSSVGFRELPATAVQHGQFDGVFATATAYAARGQELRYDPLAFQPHVMAGHPGCGTSANGVYDEPSLAGYADYSFTLWGTTANPTFSLALVGFVAQNIALDPFGLTGCSLHVDPIVVLSGIGTNAHTASLPLPNHPSMIGINLLTQWFWDDATANPAGFVSGALTRIHVR